MSGARPTAIDPATVELVNAGTELPVLREWQQQGRFRYIGASGYDWATYKNDTMGVNIDISDRFFDQPQVPGSPASILARFDFVEGLSGFETVIPPDVEILELERLRKLFGPGAIGLAIGDEDVGHACPLRLIPQKS